MANDLKMETNKQENPKKEEFEIQIDRV